MSCLPLSASATHSCLDLDNGIPAHCMPSFGLSQDTGGRLEGAAFVQLPSWCLSGACYAPAALRPRSWFAQIFIPDAPEASSSSAAPAKSAASRPPAGRASAAPDSLGWQHRTEAAAVAGAPPETGARRRVAKEDAEAMPEWWNPSPSLHVSPVYKQEVRDPPPHTLARHFMPGRCK